MMNEEYDNLPVFWDEIFSKYMDYAPIRWSVDVTWLCKDLCYLKDCLFKLVNIGVFIILPSPNKPSSEQIGIFPSDDLSVSEGELHCVITDKGYEMLKFYDFITW